MLSYHVRCEEQNEVFGPIVQRHVKQPVTHYSIAAAKAGAIVLDISEACQDSGGNKETGCLFQVGSVSKIITGALMVKLLECGEAALADPVERFIPEWRLEGVEIGHLLTHTSGIDDTCLQVAWPKKGKKNQYYSEIYRLARLAEKPGTISRYNTHAYALIAEVLERVSGQTLEQVGRENLFIPLGMSNTTYDTDSVRDKLVYPLDASTGAADVEWLDNDTTGDTGLCTTAGDLLKFGQMILNEGEYDGKRIFSKGAVEAMKRDATSGGFGKTPIGWLNSGKVDQPFPISEFRRCFSDFHSPSAIGHNGYTGCWFYIDPQLGATGAVLTNGKTMNLDGCHYKRIGNILTTIHESGNGAVIGGE